MKIIQKWQISLQQSYLDKAREKSVQSEFLGYPALGEGKEVNIIPESKTIELALKL